MDIQSETTEAFVADTIAASEIAIAVQTAVLRYVHSAMCASSADAPENITGILAGVALANAELILTFAAASGFDADAMAEGQATLLRNQVARRGSAGTG